MNRLHTIVLALAVAVGVTGAVRDRIGVAEEATPAIVGTWQRTVGDGGGTTNLYTFLADGAMIATDQDGITWLGAWEPAGENQVAFTIEALNPDGTGMGQSLRFAVPPDSGDEIPFGDGLLKRVVPES